MREEFVSEIYPSLQGEGPYAGQPHIFFRLAGCPLRCDYCDTPGSLTTEGHQTMSVETALLKIEEISKEKSIHVVSVTGGEPLSKAAFLKELFPLLKQKGLTIYLETAGFLHEAFSELDAWVDVVSMDMKLPSATGRDLWDRHEAFLAKAKEKVFVKVVVSANSKMDEIERAILLVQKIAPERPFFLQPVTPFNDVQLPDKNFLKIVLEKAQENLKDARCLAQQHKLWGIR